MSCKYIQQIIKFQGTFFGKNDSLGGQHIEVYIANWEV